MLLITLPVAEQEQGGAPFAKLLPLTASHDAVFMAVVKAVAHRRGIDTP